MQRKEIESVLDRLGLRYRWDAEGCELSGGWYLRTGSKQTSQSAEWFLWNKDGRRSNTIKTATGLRLSLIGFLPVTVEDAAAKKICDAKNRVTAAVDSIYKTFFSDGELPSHEQHKELSLAYAKLNDEIVTEQLRREFEVRRATREIGKRY